MKIFVTCSHCHESNELLKGRKVYCWSCGHRADLPRVQCDCRKCRVLDLGRERSNQQRKAHQFREAS